jgi:ADP-L-glycero-D-manno-heptose 6-epimerase
MIIVTGGAGFIGSALVWALNRRGIDDILIVDRLHCADKWKNLAALRFYDYLDKEDFIDRLQKGVFNSMVSAVIHLGACSSTTEKDADYLIENNYRYTCRLANWWERERDGGENVRFIYASSAAAYGDGALGYADDESAIDKLRPLNMYGYSKQLFDLYARRRGLLKNIVGLKYFNVFGPNEEHKGDMRSVVSKVFKSARDEGKITLFKSGRPDYGDGEQKRDFIYVKDAVEMTLFFLDNRSVSGLYNVGTGKANTWNSLANAIFSALGKEPRIDYKDMPEELEGKYQYFTQADISKIRKAGCAHTCMSLEDAVKNYVQQYLLKGKYLGDE